MRLGVVPQTLPVVMAELGCASAAAGPVGTSLVVVARVGGAVGLRANENVVAVRRVAASVVDLALFGQRGLLASSIPPKCGSVVSAGENRQHGPRQTRSPAMIFRLDPRAVDLPTMPTLASEALWCHNWPSMQGNRLQCRGPSRPRAAEEPTMRLAAAPLALIGLFLACPAAIAQGQAPNPSPTATTPPPAASPPPAPTERGRAAHADARVCLEFPTELQVIACAEKYRWAKSR